MCEEIVTPPFQFYHLPTQVPKPVCWLQGLESAIRFALFFWGGGGWVGSHRAVCLKKIPKINVFVYVCFET